MVAEMKNKVIDAAKQIPTATERLTEAVAAAKKIPTATKQSLFIDETLERADVDYGSKR